MATTKNKKVRSACQRCRVRRIKCDGQLPSCSNCTKAGEPCIDVDSQNQDVLLPRNFSKAARARIQWLEAVIRERLPDVDLSEGPQVEILAEVPSKHLSKSSHHDAEERPEVSSTYEGPAATRSALNSRQAMKRTHEEVTHSDHEDSLPEGAHSVAVNLGMLSLNSDSSQRHYLGSSSGLLFSNLIAASPSNAGGSPEYNRNAPDNSAGLMSRTIRPEAAQRRFQSFQRLLNENLPARNDAIILLTTYIRETHPDFPVLDPKGLFAALEALYECSTIENEGIFHNDWPFSVQDFRWNGQSPLSSNAAGKSVPLAVVAFIFFMIFNVAAIVKVRARNYEFPPAKFYRAALLFSGDCFSQISVSSIQAIVVLIIHSILTPAEVNLWTLIHIAMAQVVELGLHREPQSAGAGEKNVQQIHRFIFYVIYSLDRSISAIQGRPLGFRDETFDVKIPEEEDSVIDFDDEQIPSHFSADVLKYSTHVFKLDRIVSDIKLHLYHLPGISTFETQTNPITHQQRIMADLQSWWNKVSENELGILGLDHRQKQMWLYKLKIRYHTTMLLLFQPSQSIRTPTESSLQTCFDSASAILKIYQLLHDNHCLHFGWRTVQNIFAAGATVMYTFWTCPRVQADASIIELSRSLRICSSLLSVGGESWPSVKIGKKSLETVADLTIRKLYTLNIPSKQRRLIDDPKFDRRLQIESHNMTESIHTQSDSAAVTRSIVNPLEGSSGAQPSATTIEFDGPQPYDHSGQSENIGIHQYPEAGDEVHAYLDDVSFQIEGHLDMVPEIETFLADFDNSEFSWNFPLSSLDEQNFSTSFFYAS